MSDKNSALDDIMIGKINEGIEKQEELENKMNTLFELVKTNKKEIDLYIKYILEQINKLEEQEKRLKRNSDNCVGGGI